MPPPIMSHTYSGLFVGGRQYITGWYWVIRSGRLYKGVVRGDTVGYSGVILDGVFYNFVIMQEGTHHRSRVAHIGVSIADNHISYFPPMYTYGHRSCQLNNMIDLQYRTISFLFLPIHTF